MARRGWAVVLAVALGGCGGHSTPPKPPPVGLAKAAIVHLRALARIGARNGHTRAAGTRGYDESVAYVARRLRDAGYRVHLQEVPFPVFRERSKPRLAAGERRVPVTTLSYSPPGRVRAALDRAGRGCRSADFGSARGRIAVAERGVCTFRVKARLAQASGARGLIVADRGSAGAPSGSLIRPGIRIPAVATGAAGLKLRGEARLVVDTVAETRRTRNVIAERPGPPAKRVAMLGAHLDSVREGPGINDNGSGVASTLALAERLRDRRGLRFGFWGAEELGLYGSRGYVARQAGAYGGRAGRPLDPCYHRRCDTFDRVDQKVLVELAVAAGRALVAIGN